jgi:hypothetical protein
VLDVGGVRVRNVRCSGYTTGTISSPGAFSGTGWEESLCSGSGNVLYNASAGMRVLCHILSLFVTWS